MQILSENDKKVSSLTQKIKLLEAENNKLKKNQKNDIPMLLERLESKGESKFEEKLSSKTDLEIKDIKSTLFLGDKYDDNKELIKKKVSDVEENHYEEKNQRHEKHDVSGAKPEPHYIPEIKQDKHEEQPTSIKNHKNKENSNDQIQSHRQEEPKIERDNQPSHTHKSNNSNHSGKHNSNKEENHHNHHNDTDREEKTERKQEEVHHHENHEEKNNMHEDQDQDQDQDYGKEEFSNNNANKKDEDENYGDFEN